MWCLKFGFGSQNYSGEITDVSGVFQYEMKCSSRGFHEYHRLWTPRIRQSLTVQPEFWNVYDPYALALLTKLAETILEMDIVGHLPREISRFCRYFINYRGKMEAGVTDINYRRSPIPSGRLEIPLFGLVIKARSSGSRSRRGSRKMSWRDLVMDRAKDEWIHFSITLVIICIQAALFFLSGIFWRCIF